MGATRQLCDYIARTSYEDIPEKTREAAKTAILNIIGTSLGGYETRIGKMHVNLAKKWGAGNPESTIMGDGTKVSLPMAVYANGNLGFALDYEDMIHYIVHPGFITTSAALAMCEQRGMSGKDMLTAVVLGFEIGGRLADSMQPTPERGAKVWGEQYHPFCAATVAGKLMGFDADQMDSAFGIAGTYSLVPSAYKYFGLVEETRPMKEVKMGWGWMAMGGVAAALSVEEGFGGGHGVLDGQQGFYAMAGSDRCDWDVMTRGLGTEWFTDETEYKIHPSIGFNHPGYFATRSLVEENDIKAEQVEGIKISGMMMHNIGDVKPHHAVDAMFSLPYTVVSTIMREPLLPTMYSDEKLNDPLLRDLLGRTECVHLKESDAAFFNEQRMSFNIEIRMKDGKVYRRDVEFPRDKPPYGRPEVEKKVRDLAGCVLPSDQVEEIIKSVNDLENVASVRDIIGKFKRA